MNKEYQGVASDEARATAVEPVPVSPLRDGIANAWPCGHQRSAENTQSVGVAGVRCRTCRRRITREYARRKRGYYLRHPSDEIVILIRRFAPALKRLKRNRDWSDGPAPWQISNTLVSARRRGLCESKVVREYPVELRWRFSHLGLSAFEFVEALEAQAIEARSVKTERLGPQGESAVGETDAPNPISDTPNA